MDRTSPILDAITTKVKQRVLAATLLHPERSWYLRELARSLSLAASTVQHELRLFASAGLLTRREDGNRVYYQADTRSPVFRALAELLVRTSGIADVARSVLDPFAAGLDVAFIYGSVAAGEEQASSDVDLMVIGKVPLSDIAAALREAEEQIGRSINPTVYTSEEFIMKIRDGHHFLTSVIKTELLFVYGKADDLAELISRALGKATPDKHRGVARPSRHRRTGPQGRKG